MDAVKYVAQNLELSILFIGSAVFEHVVSCQYEVTACLGVLNEDGCLLGDCCINDGHSIEILLPFPLLSIHNHLDRYYSYNRLAAPKSNITLFTGSF